MIVIHSKELKEGEIYLRKDLSLILKGIEPVFFELNNVIVNTIDHIMNYIHNKHQQRSDAETTVSTYRDPLLNVKD